MQGDTSAHKQHEHRSIISLKVSSTKPTQNAVAWGPGLYTGSSVLLCYDYQDCGSFPVLFLFALHTTSQLHSDLLGEQGITQCVSKEPHDGEIEVSWGPPMLNVQGKRETCCSFIWALCKPALMRPLSERCFELFPDEHGHIFPLSSPRTPLLHCR